MSQTLNINNYGSSNLTQQTRLDADSAVSAANFTVQNNAGFSAGDYFVVGTLGAETTELRIVTSITGSTTITPTVVPAIAHTRFDYVYKLFGNQLKVYRAPNVNGLQPADSAFTSIATIDIQPDQAYTAYTDSAGSSDDWYKFTYYNSTTTGETNLSDSSAVRGGGTGDYCSIDSIRKESGFTYAKYITDDMIDAKRKAAQDEINGTLHGFYTVPFTAPINPFISDICTRLAAGLLLLEQYGQLNANTTANGDDKVKGARADLLALAEKQKVLVDTTGTSMALAGSTGGISSWPDSTTNATDATGIVDLSTMTEGQDAGHAFARSDILGYYGRKY